MSMRRVGRQVAGPGQHSRSAARSQWFATMHRVVQQLWVDNAVRQVATVRLQPSASTMGHLSGTAIGLVMQRHHTVPLTECRVVGDKIRHAHAVEYIIYYS
jgi:hypothetical protein